MFSSVTPLAIKVFATEVLGSAIPESSPKLSVVAGASDPKDCSNNLLNVVCGFNLSPKEIPAALRYS